MRREPCGMPSRRPVPEGLQADAFVDTQITRPALSLNVVGPQTATVGERVQFRIEVTNAGDQVLDNVTISDRFDAGLQQADGLTSPIQKLLGRLDPGQTEGVCRHVLRAACGADLSCLEVTRTGRPVRPDSRSA